MKNVVVIKSSILADNSQSSQLVDYFKSKINANVTEHDFGANPLPYYDINAAVGTRGEPQTDAQRDALALSDKLIGEVKATDVLVLGAPMYNLNVPAQLKSYIDFLFRAGVTFQYGANGPEGLIKGKKAVVILTYGGIYKDTAIDFTKNYLQTALGFIGITDVEFVQAEALAYGPEAAEKAVAAAEAELARIAQAL